MSDCYTANRLPAAQIEQAFPLLRLAAPEVSLAQWHHYALAILAGQQPATSGIIAVRGPQDYISGLFAYQVEQNLQCGSTLQARDVVAAGIGWRGLMAAMVAAMADVASQHRCDAIHAELLGVAAGSNPTKCLVGEKLREAGFELCRGHLCKRLSEVPCPRL